MIPTCIQTLLQKFPNVYIDSYMYIMIPTQAKP